MIRSRSHVPALDGVRGIAILLVIAQHAALLPQTGWVGVDLFFVLSGYLITGILVRAREAPHYLRNFWMRRALRIFPAYYVYCLIVVLVLPLHTGQRVADPWWQYLYLTNFQVMHGWNAPDAVVHLWSVAVEEQFYLIWPLVVWRVPVGKLRHACAIGIVAALALRVMSVLVHPTALERYTLTPMRMDSLLVGAWLALSMFPASARGRRRWGTLAVGAGVGALWLTVAEGPHGPLVETIGYSLYAVAFGGLVWACRDLAAVRRVCSSRLLRVAGKYSYAAYLGHRLVLETLGNHGVPYGVPLMLAGSLVTFSLAWVSWRVLEAPLLSLKRFFPEPAASLSSPPSPGQDQGQLVPSADTQR